MARETDVATAQLEVAERKRRAVDLEEDLKDGVRGGELNKPPVETTDDLGRVFDHSREEGESVSW